MANNSTAMLYTIEFVFSPNSRVNIFTFDGFVEQLKLFLPGKFTSSFISLEAIIFPPTKFKVLFSENLC